MPAATLIAAASLLLAGAAPTVSPPPAPAPAASRDAVSFSRLAIADGERPAIEAGVWLPDVSGPAKRPLIVISHGNGGDFRSHHDTARALAKAGFVVAALTHTGDNWRDQSRAADVADRTRQLSVLIDHMLGQWEGRDSIDAARIGAFGFSAGGFTVLAAAGGEADLTRMEGHCRAHPEFYDCRLISRHAGALSGEPPRPARDGRLKALVVAAPALGFSFTRQGLAGVTQPVQLWQAGQDRILPAPFYVEPVRAGLPRRPQFHRVDGAGHFDFLAPCDARLATAAPAICAPTPGFDRSAFHERFNREVVAFFKAQLAAS